ncbi:MAG: hypothetical protein ABL916_24665 [Burkholderiaceae bacterium]
MIEQLGRRCALVMLASMTLAVTMGLMAWGPVELTASAHRYADERVWLGMAGAANVWVNAAMFAAGAWGWRATRASHWPLHLRTPWQLFQACAMVSAGAAALYHARPQDNLFVLTHVATASGFMMLTLGLLAERVHSGFGSHRVCFAVLCGIAVTGAAMLLAQAQAGHVDMRPLLLLEIIPVLVIPAGALSLPGRSTQVFDWVVVLTLYALAKVLETGDALVLEGSGWISGHTLMHLALTAAVGWMAYCAVRACAATDSGGKRSGEVSHRDTSLNTGA